MRERSACRSRKCSRCDGEKRAGRPCRAVHDVLRAEIQPASHAGRCSRVASGTADPQRAWWAAGSLSPNTSVHKAAMMAPATGQNEPGANRCSGSLASATGAVFRCRGGGTAPRLAGCQSGVALRKQAGYGDRADGGVDSTIRDRQRRRDVTRLPFSGSPSAYSNERSRSTDPHRSEEPRRSSDPPRSSSLQPYQKRAYQSTTSCLVPGTSGPSGCGSIRAAWWSRTRIGGAAEIRSCAVV